MTGKPDLRDRKTYPPFPMASNKKALGFIFITILVDVIGIGIIIPVIPTLIKNLTGEGLSEASGYGGWLLFSFAIMQFLFAPLMGELSDRFGRRPILLFALFGLGVDYIFHAYAPSIGWLFAGRILAGGFGASYTVATAYIADISSPEDKAKNFGLVGAAFGLGFIIGPAIGGICAKWGVEVPFLVAAGLSLANMLYGFFILPESLPKEKRRKFEWKKANPVGSLLMIRSYPALIGLVIAFFLANLAGQAMPAVWSYFTMMEYDWTETGVGVSLAIVGILVAVVQGVLLGKMVKYFGTRKIIVGGFILWTIGMCGFAFAYEAWILFVFLVPYVLGGVASPTLQGLLSNQVPDDEQGKLQGALTSMISVTAFVGPIVMAQLFSYFTDEVNPIYLPGAPYLLGTVLLAVGTLFAVNAMRRIKTD